jgi:two-component system, NarL family, nitrate/nitrite response regulator NarL
MVAAPQESSVPKSVLIVDDHEAIRRELRRLFESHSEFTVCGEAVDGADALSKAQQLSPNLIILDFAMPEMNGLEAVAALQHIMPDTILFLLSAYHTRELELAACQFGARAVVSKYDKLDEIIRRTRTELKLDSGCDVESESRPRKRLIPRARSGEQSSPGSGLIGRTAPRRDTVQAALAQNIRSSCKSNTKAKRER